MSRPRSLARSHGLDALIVILAVEGALEVALRGDSVHEPGSRSGSRCRRPR